MTTELARQLERAARGEPEAFDRAYQLLYDELTLLARAQRARWRGNETLNTTALVHEAYLKLAGPADGTAARWEGRRHFLALVSKVMRQVLVNYAEAQQAEKRGGGVTPIGLELVEIAAPGTAGARSTQADEDVLAVHEALTRLAAIEPRQVRVVECRFFAGMSIPETAEALTLSPATVKRDWQLASRWLQRDLGAGGPSGSSG
jgi:RNA polymerase sigma factor (TIGR02999 family)